MIESGMDHYRMPKLQSNHVEEFNKKYMLERIQSNRKHCNENSHIIIWWLDDGKKKPDWSQSTDITLQII